MSRKNILNLSLFIVVCVLANLIYFSETKDKDTRLKPLSDLDITSIEQLTIRHNDSQTVITKQKDNHWTIDQPIKIDANNFRINSILKLINAPVHNQYTLDEIDSGHIGLNNPVTSISFNDEVISFGSINPATGLRYIQFRKKIHTIEDVYFPLISSHFGTLVSLDLIPSGSKINKLILLNQTIDQDDNGLWRSNISITADNIAKAIDSWQTSQAFGIHEYLERDVLADVFVYTEDQQEPISYQITDIDPWLIIARPESGLEYHLDLEAYDQLITPQ